MFPVFFHVLKTTSGLLCVVEEDPEVFPDDEIKQVFFDDNVRLPTDWMGGKSWSLFFAVDMYNIYIILYI